MAKTVYPISGLSKGIYMKTFISVVLAGITLFFLYQGYESYQTDKTQEVARRLELELSTKSWLRGINSKLDELNAAQKQYKKVLTIAPEGNKPQLAIELNEIGLKVSELKEVKEMLEGDTPWNPELVKRIVSDL